jgi:hypothetical protein
MEKVSGSFPHPPPSLNVRHLLAGQQSAESSGKYEARSMKSRFAFLPVLALLAASVLFAQTPAPPGPIPAPMQSAHKIFIANAGMDAFSLQAFQELDLTGTDPYNVLYATIKSWPQYQLISSPADADLVLQIRFTAPLTNVGDHGNWGFQRVLANTTWQFQTDVTIYDAKTHFLLWAITEPVHPANLKGTWRKNIAEANAALAGDLKSLLLPTTP